MEGRVAHLLSNWVVHAFSGTLSLVIWRIAQDIKNWEILGFDRALLYRRDRICGRNEVEKVISVSRE